MAMKVLSIDPGREKCGIAIVHAPIDSGLKVLWQVIVPRQTLPSQLPELIDRFHPDAFLLGDATTSRELAALLQLQWPQMPLHIVDEAGSTLAARELFWQAHPPRGWRRCVPLSLQMPPVPLDDFAAIVLARRFFHNQSTLVETAQN